jgi:hypothetical protein
MAFKTFLKPSESVMVSLATGAMVYGVYQYSMPSIAEVHATDAHNTNIDSGRKKAMWTSLGVVSGMFLLTRDPNVFMVGGAAFLAIEWSYRHANSTDAQSGKIVSTSKSQAMGDYSVPDIPDYVPEYMG